MARGFALHDYTASEDGEVSLVAGATVHVISKGSGVWWLVECNGFSGYVPPAFVELLPESEQKEYFEVLAVYTHEASSETEITFYEGEKVLVLESDNDEWWYGLIRSAGAGDQGARVAGYFASNFVERVSDEEPPAVMQRRLATIRMMKPSLPQRPDIGTLPRPRKVDAAKVAPAAEELPPPLPSREDRQLLTKLERERMRAAKLEQDALEKAAKLAQSQSEIQSRDSEISKMRAKEEEMQRKMAEMEAQLRHERERAEASARAAEEKESDEVRERALAEARERELAEAEVRERERAEAEAREREQARAAAAEAPAAPERGAATVQSVQRVEAVSAEPAQEAVSPREEAVSPREEVVSPRSAAAAPRKKKASKFDVKEKKKFVSGGVQKRNKTRKYGVSACETKAPSKDLNNLSGDAFLNS